ncbi:MAG: YggS family pyridoxal phosphate enzyme, partial [Pseudomonadota bacterium]
MAYDEILERVAEAESAAGRAAGSTELIAISKVQPLDRILPVLKAGHRIFGENRVQEAAGRWPPLLEQFDGIALHLVGPLQSNKARQAVEMFGTIHSLDREKLARRLADLAQERGACPDLFVQVNTGEEPQKAGILPGAADAFVTTCRGYDLPVQGLMCIPPVDEEPSLHFALLAKIAERNGLDGLSMGMSG